VSPVSASVRAAVRDRAGNRCEYCRKPANVTPYSHQIDHVLPQKHGGLDTVANLAWAGFWCNNHKGSDTGSYGPITGNLTPLFNPRTQVWSDHFSLNVAIIVGTTDIGRVTVQLLKLNDPAEVALRTTLIAGNLW
jgi:hypothetical protein